MPDPSSFIHAQLRLECVGFDDEGLLIRIPGQDPDEIARLQAYEHSDGFDIYFRQDVPQDIRNKISSFPPSLLFQDGERGRSVIDELLHCPKIIIYETYIFKHLPEENLLADVVVIEDVGLGAKGAANRPVFAIVKDGRIISSCVSTRENDESAECYTYSEEGFRQLGFGWRVTTAWGRHQLLKSKIPFYSHEGDNLDSRALANSLNLEWKFRMIAYD